MTPTTLTPAQHPPPQKNHTDPPSPLLQEAEAQLHAPTSGTPAATGGEEDGAFFDAISCEALERLKLHDDEAATPQRKSLAEQRALDTETFGAHTVRHYGWRGRGRGGRGRGRGRYGRGGYGRGGYGRGRGGSGGYGRGGRGEGMGQAPVEAAA